MTTVAAGAVCRAALLCSCCVLLSIVAHVETESPYKVQIPGMYICRRYWCREQGGGGNYLTKTSRFSGFCLLFVKQKIDPISSVSVCENRQKTDRFNRRSVFGSPT